MTIWINGKLLFSCYHKFSKLIQKTKCENGVKLNLLPIIKPVFFSQRYRTEGQGVLTLSVYVADTKKITGVLTAKADEQSIAYRIFSLKSKEIIPTSSS